ncbi:hypothetical protein CERSUDRAFT_85522 [Gelatoporia subvermispora B]|uniref:Uncharacterized protein n=1 Tax=Ceriporiopsis subvermispora (strain B) TaxID=914234 RepID=M2R9X4_CERS8|nr:hypothetical protein CERSUDRAFT_85522 [Gelatoporia subvermispora B]
MLVQLHGTRAQRGLRIPISKPQNTEALSFVATRLTKQADSIFFAHFRQKRPCT